MGKHPIETGFVWDSNGIFDEELGIWTPRWIPNPLVPSDPSKIDAFYASNPDIKWAQRNWGATLDAQKTTNSRLMAEAVAAGIEF